jgi:hypothetical protein
MELGLSIKLIPLMRDPGKGFFEYHATIDVIAAIVATKQVVFRIPSRVDDRGRYHEGSL